MKAFKIYCGIGFDKKNRELPPKFVTHAIKAVRSDLVSIFGGYIETNGVGGYSSAENGVVHEPCIIWEVFAHNDSQPIYVARTIRARFNQESVCLVGPTGDVEFVGA